MGRNMTEMREGDKPISRGGAFQARGKASSKALRQVWLGNSKEASVSGAWGVGKRKVGKEAREVGDSTAALPSGASCLCLHASRDGELTPTHIRTSLTLSIYSYSGPPTISLILLLEVPQNPLLLLANSLGT